MSTEVLDSTGGIAAVFGWKVLASIVGLTCNLLLVRLVVESLGMETFAGINLVATMTAALPFADLGMGAAITNAASDLGHSYSKELAVRTLGASIRVLFGSSLCICTLAILAGATDLWPRILGDGLPPEEGFGLAATIVMILFGIGLVLNAAQRILQGWQLNSLVIRTGMIVAPMALALAWLLLKVDAPSASLSVVTSLCGTLVCVFLWHEVSVRMPSGTVRAILCSKVSGRSIWAVLSIGVFSTIVSLGVSIMLQSQRLVLSHLATTWELGIFSLVASLWLPLQAILATGAQFLWPKYRSLRAAPGAAVKALRSDVLMFILLGLGAAGGMMVFGPMIVNLMAPDHASTIPFSVFLWAGVLLLVQAAHLPSGMFLTDTSGFAIQSVLVALTAVVSFGLCLVLVVPLGAAGAFAAPALAIGLIQFPATFVIALKRRR